MRNDLKLTLKLATALVLTGARLFAADFDIRNETEFKRIIPAGAKVEKLAGNFQFVEGPAWLPAHGGSLIFSDIPANEIKQWSPKGGIATFRKPSANANGNFLDPKGVLYTCEHSGRRVAMLDKKGNLVTVVDSYNGKKLNSPNDVVTRNDGTIWFTDPAYGIKSEQQELPGEYVYRYDPKTKELAVVVKDFDKPNGLCFSPKQDRLYVADSGKPHHIRVFDVDSDKTLSNGRVFCVIDKGGPDGIRCDKEGRVWSSAGDGVHVFDGEGRLIGKILTPESPANLCFGGKNNEMLFITARTSLYAIPASVKGKKTGWFFGF